MGKKFVGVQFGKDAYLQSGVLRYGTVKYSEGLVKHWKNGIINRPSPTLFNV